MDINTKVESKFVLMNEGGMYIVMSKYSGHIGYKYDISETYELRKATTFYGIDRDENIAIKKAFKNCERVNVEITESIKIVK